MGGDSRLPDPLAGADDRDRRHVDLGEAGRLEAEVGTDVGEPGGEGPRGPVEALRRAEHGLVGEVDDDLGVAEVLAERHAVAGVRAQLLAATDEDRPGPLVGQLGERPRDDVGGVVAVDQSDRPHRFVVTSLSIREVYFSYSSVSRSNWMIRSCP